MNIPQLFQKKNVISDKIIDGRDVNNKLVHASQVSRKQDFNLLVKGAERNAMDAASIFTQHGLVPFVFSNRISLKCSFVVSEK